MKRLLSILVGILCVGATVLVFSTSVDARGPRGGGGSYHGGPRLHHGGAYRYHGGTRYYRGPAVGWGIVNGYDDCRLEKRCFIDPYGRRYCRWVTICY